MSHNVILTHEDKTYSGAFIASASIPWGASKGDDDLGGYHLVWTRDMVQSATALLACGRGRDGAAGAGVSGLHAASGWQLCAELLDRWDAVLDGESSWMRWRFRSFWRGGCGRRMRWRSSGVIPFVETAAGFLVRYAPITQQERWEENAGYSPSTLAAVIAALVCAADLARAHQAPELAAFLEEYADWIEAHLDEWTTTDDGCLLPGVTRHYMRIRPPAEGEPFHNPAMPPGHIVLANREPGEKAEFRGAGDYRRGISGAGAVWDPAGGRSADCGFAEGGGPCAEDRDAVRRLLAAL